MSALPTKADVERSLGFTLTTFKRLKGGSSPNFKAIRASDGLPFLVKLLPRETRAYIAPALISHIDELAGTPAVRRLFASAAEWIGDYRLICLEWCEGVCKLPHQLSEDEIKDFCEAYLALSDALQRTTHVAEEDPLGTWRESILATGGRGAPLIRRYLARRVSSADCVRNPARTKVIFGDFHAGNIVFRGGKVYRFIDLESFQYGYATDDLVRYVTCAYEHLPFGGLGYTRRTLAAFEKMVAHLPFSRDEWRSAIVFQILRKLEGYDTYSLFTAANLIYRLRFYDLLLERLCT